MPLCSAPTIGKVSTTVGIASIQLRFRSAPERSFSAQTLFTMNILFVTPYPPSRIRVRPYELLRALAKRQHKITLATIWASPEDRQDIDMLRELGIEIVEFHLPTARSLTNALLALPTSTPLQ